MAIGFDIAAIDFGGPFMTVAIEDDDRHGSDISLNWPLDFVVGTPMEGVLATACEAIAAFLRECAEEADRQAAALRGSAVNR